MNHLLYTSAFSVLKHSYRNSRYSALFRLCALFSGLYLAPLSVAQPLVTPWGNVTGIHIEGEKMPFETSLRAVNPDWSGFVQSSKYNWEGTQNFALENKTYSCSHFLQGTQLNYSTQVSETGRGSARVSLQLNLNDTLAMAGAFFCVELPATEYAGAKFELLGSDQKPLSLLPKSSGLLQEQLRVVARGFRVIGSKRTMEVLADSETEIILRQDFVDHPAYLNDPKPALLFVRQDSSLKVADYQIYFSLLPATAKKGASAKASYSIKVDGQLDQEPVQMTLAAAKAGRVFAGIGGNFRMQYPELDTQVVDYCLTNLNVTWGRIAFPWAEWQPEEPADKSAEFLAGKMSPYFRAQLEIAKTLTQRRIPLIASVWVPPDWAVDHSRKLAKGVKLDPNKLDSIAESIANWLVFLKQNYGIEIALFSFNETDYGVEVHQSSAEHALANKVIGARFAQKGLITRMLLGDTGACTVSANEMVHASQDDRSIAPYLGGISFHSYHGVTDEALKAWSDSANKTNLPLFLDEGGPDSAAHRYPLIWTTPWFAQLEVDQYIRVGAACQPLSILPWQLNSDYSLLAGGGIYGDQGPLRPTQRFWSLKQLGLLSGAFWLPVSVNRPDIHCAALGDIVNHVYAVHITNNGAGRRATICGIPADVKKMRVYVTDATRGMQLMAVKGVVDGKVAFLLEGQTFTTLISE